MTGLLPRAIPASLATLLLLSGAGSAAAQTTVRGQLLDESTRAGISAARVELLAGDTLVSAAASNADGWFELRTGERTSYSIRVERNGYAVSTTASSELRRSQAGHVEILLRPTPVELDALAVEARAVALSPGLAGFEERAERQMGGAFIRRADLESRSAATAIEMLHGVPGVRLTRVSTAGFVVVMSRAVMSLRRGGERCPANAHDIDIPACSAGCRVELFVDGVKVQNTPNAMLNQLLASELHGIEVYRGAAETPPEFGGSNARCGVIVVWTRRG